MRYAAIWLTLTLMACGGDPGEPLLLASGSGSVDGTPFTPAFGASSVLTSGTVNSVLGTGEISCASITGGEPSDGVYVQVQVPQAAVGIPSKNMVMFSVVSGGHLQGGGSGDGSVEVTRVTDDVLGLKVDYSKTISDHAYSLKGTFEVHRCR
jgi:hypothetical protein